MLKLRLDPHDIPNDAEPLNLRESAWDCLKEPYQKRHLLVLESVPMGAPDLHSMNKPSAKSGSYCSVWRNILRSRDFPNDLLA